MVPLKAQARVKITTTKTPKNEMSKELYGWKVVDLFLTFDKDGDFYLSIDEALPLLKQVLSEANSTEIIDTLLSEDVVTLAARFTPLNLSTMMKNWDEEIGNNESFIGLFEWIHPSIPEKEFGVSKFKDLLPEDLKNVPPPGTVYSILDLGYVQLEDLSSNRFYPPQVQRRGAFLHRLFSMIHQHPFLATRSDPQGAMGCVRAVNEDYIEVLFRIHVEFQLNEPPRLPFWFTPGQFTGNLIVSRDLTKVKSFHLYVPSTKSLNVDMEWLTDKNDPEVMEVDIGFMPYMEIKSIGCSHKSDADLLEKNECENKTIVWQREISYEEAKDALDVKFFPFKQVKYYNLTRTLRSTALKDPQVLSLLAEHFISTWSLTADLKALAADPAEPYSHLAQKLLNVYEFPVMLIIASCDGEIIHKMNANDLLDLGTSFFENILSNPTTFNYIQFLKDGIQKSEIQLGESSKKTSVS
ncbi:hypothetical protein Btru_069301 [Bulinus truncatus]|nr:hypothetical protein Btru_069301 [Bulinus truncatus]